MHKLNEAGPAALLGGLEEVHDAQEDDRGREGVFDIPSRAECDGHEGHETEDLVPEELIEALGDGDRVGCEQALVHDDEGEHQGLGLDEKFGGFRHRTEKVFDLTNHLFIMYGEKVPG